MNPDNVPTIREAINMSVAELLPLLEKNFASRMDDTHSTDPPMSTNVALAHLIVVYRAIADLQKRVNDLESGII